jgi:hypothetical protein
VWWNIIKVEYRFLPEETWQGRFLPHTNTVEVNLSDFAETEEHDIIDTIIDTIGHEYAHLASSDDIRREEDAALDELLHFIHYAGEVAATFLKETNTSGLEGAAKIGLDKWQDQLGTPIKKIVSCVFMDELFAYRSTGKIGNFDKFRGLYIKNLHNQLKQVLTDWAQQYTDESRTGNGKQMAVVATIVDLIKERFLRRKIEFYWNQLGNKYLRMKNGNKMRKHYMNVLEYD